MRHPTADETGTTNASNRDARAMSFRTKLILGICTLVVMTGLAVTWTSYRAARSSTQALGESVFHEVSGHAVTRTRDHVLSAAPVVEAMRNLSGDTLALNDTDRLARQFLAVLKANPSLCWVYFGDVSGMFTGALRRPDGGYAINQSRVGMDGRTAMVEHDVLPDGTWRVAKRDDNSGYDPRKRPYYTKAAQVGPGGEPVWLEPYMFYIDGVPGVSCAAPVRDAGGKLLGVVSVDFDLRALSRFVSTLSASENSRVFLFTRDGSLLAHPNLRTMTPEKRGTAAAAESLPTLADAADPLVDAYRENLRSEYLSAAAGADSFRSFGFEKSGVRYLASATTFHVSGDQAWVVGAVAPESDFFAGVWHSRTVALFAAGTAVMLGALLAYVMARSVARPVASLIGFTRRVSDGQLDAKADFAGGGREFRELSGALNQMIEDLRDRLRLRHSLNLAMEVQQRLLPCRPPAVRGLDVAGHSTYCDETGGDYYDFLMIDPSPATGDGEVAGDRLLIALGDVMGHGIAAALVMASARAVLRDRAGTTGSLAELMSRLNALLAADLEGTRFMTMHLAYVDASAGTYRWSSAGHDPAIIYDPATDEFLEIDEAEFPLGVMDDTAYEEHRYASLRYGQVILVGTDGIWEMPNTAGEMFGKDRLREVIRASAAGSAAGIVQAVLAAVQEFRGECRPVDDVTFVVIKQMTTPAGLQPDPSTAGVAPASRTAALAVEASGDPI